MRSLPGPPPYRGRRRFNALMTLLLGTLATVTQVAYGWTAFVVLLVFALLVVGWIYALAAVEDGDRG